MHKLPVIGSPFFNLKKAPDTNKINYIEMKMRSSKIVELKITPTKLIIASNSTPILNDRQQYERLAILWSR